MTFELGVYSFANTPRLPDGSRGPTAQALRDVLEAIKLADEVGLDFFGVGEHHMRAMPLSSPTSVVNAAAATTSRIKLSTAVTVLSTDDPIRVFQQLATAASLAPGRIELVAGRGSSTITFPLFDHNEHDYDMLYASKLALLMAVNSGENVTWHGPHRRRPLENVTVFPRPEEPLKIWLGTGGSPDSVYRAVELGCRCSSASSAALPSTGRATGTPTAPPGPRPVTPPSGPTSRSPRTGLSPTPATRPGRLTWSTSTA